MKTAENELQLIDAKSWIFLTQLSDINFFVLIDAEGVDVFLLLIFSQILGGDFTWHKVLLLLLLLFVTVLNLLKVVFSVLFYLLAHKYLY